MKAIRSRALIYLAAAAALLPGTQLRGQGLVPAGVGGMIGLGAGGYVALGIVALKARHGDYLFSPSDVFGWESTAVIAGTATGVGLGAWDQARLRRTVIGAAAAGLVGTGIGTVIGRRIWSPPEGKWAGGVIGGAAGILAGAAVGMLWPAPAAENGAADSGLSIVLSLPAGP